MRRFLTFVADIALAWAEYQRGWVGTLAFLIRLGGKILTRRNRTLAFA